MKKLLNTLIAILFLANCTVMQAQVDYLRVVSTYYGDGDKISKAKAQLASICNHVFDDDLCKGLGVYSFYVYLGYHTGSYNKAITGMLLVEGSKKTSVTYEGRNYYPVPGIGESDGNLNQYAQSKKTPLYLYVTTDGNDNYSTPLLEKLEIVYSANNRDLVQLAKLNDQGEVTSITGAGNLNSEGKSSLYLKMTWHRHGQMLINNITPSGHNYKCSTCDYVTGYDNHYFPGVVERTDLHHVYRCQACDYEKKEEHSFSLVVAGEHEHYKECEICKYEMAQNHDASLHTTYYPVDEIYHMGICKDCSFMSMSRHNLLLTRILSQADCCHEGEEEYTCQTSGCGAVIVRKVARKSHDYVNGICVNSGCIDRFEPATSDSLTGEYLIFNAGNLIWFANLVNTGESGASALLQENIEIPESEKHIMIGKNPGVPYNGEFNGCNRIIKGLDSPLMGYVGDKGMVENIHIRSAVIRNSESAAAIALINKGKIFDCTVAESSVTSLSASPTGAICAYNSGYIENCSVGKDAVVSSAGSTNGGISGINHGNVIDCTSLAVGSDGSTLPLVGSGEQDETVSSETKGSFYLQSLANTKSSIESYSSFMTAELGHFSTDSTTGVAHSQAILLTPKEPAMENSLWFDIYGRRVSKEVFTEGIYLNNGKKYLIY